MTLARDIGGEIIKALAVLALVFLSFAHQPAGFARAGADGATLTLADLSFCGDVDGSDADHAPCHACRAGIADLPAAPCVAEPAYGAALIAGFTRPEPLGVPTAALHFRNPRAPPAVV